MIVKIKCDDQTARMRLLTMLSCAFVVFLQISLSTRNVSSDTGFNFIIDLLNLMFSPAFSDF